MYHPKIYINSVAKRPENNSQVKMTILCQGMTPRDFFYKQGELVFQTGLIGYPETFTDPSFTGQFLVMTYPLIGNYGLPSIEYLESHNGICPAAIIVSENYQHPPDHPNLNKAQNMLTISENNQQIILWDADTRALTEFIREYGDCQTMITLDPQIWPDSQLNPVELSCKSANYNFNPEILQQEHRLYSKYNSRNQKKPNVLFINLGAKVSQYRALSESGDLSITTITESELPSLDPVIVCQVYSGIFISNGPGDPRNNTRAIKFISKLMEQPNRPVMFGICLGHQIIAIAAGHTVSKMKYGHRGINVPVVLMDESGKEKTNYGLLTSQNHGYEVLITDESEQQQQKIKARKLFTNANDDSCEGLYYLNRGAPIFSVQFHPEACPGPEESNFLFRVFEQSVNAAYRDILPATNCIYNIIKHRLLIARQFEKEPVFNDNPQLITSTIQSEKPRKILILGSGGIQIGQAGEFDYSGAQAIKSFKDAGYETILVNPNIATYQTSLADRVYYLPVTPHFVRQIIDKERPNAITVSFGGQTALNTGLALQNYLSEKGIEVLGTPLRSIQISEDRNLFKEHLLNLPKGKIHSAPSRVIAATAAAALETAKQLGGYPLLVRAGFCLGGAGSGFVYSDAELLDKVDKVASTGNKEVILDADLRGWKELELEIMRDRWGNKLCICGMENLDPLGVHTGESIVTAPCQTIPDAEFQEMRTMAFNIVDSLDIVGECNVQFAVNPGLARPTRSNGGIYVIEMNARLSRSSALASKATGYPIAAIAAQLQLGQSLTQIRNKVTGTLTSAFFEPALDYVVVKIPRWDLSKAPGVSHELGTAMKSVGEVMGIGRSFKEALLKAMRMVGMPQLTPALLASDRTASHKPIEEEIAVATPERLIKLFKWLYSLRLTQYQTQQQPSNTLFTTATCGITPWFIWQMWDIVDWLFTNYQSLSNNQETRTVAEHTIRKGKQLGLSDEELSAWLGISACEIRAERDKYNIKPKICVIDTVAGEFPCATNYFYLSYLPSTQSQLVGFSSSLSSLITGGKQRIIVLGSGVYRIGSSVEFDWCAVSAATKARELGYETVMINHNPETVSTDYDEVDYLFFDELSAETVSEIYQMANNGIAAEVHTRSPCRGVIVSMGGQAANNIVTSLAQLGVPILGTPAEMIDTAENRYKFSRLCDAIQVKQPKWSQVTNYADLIQFCAAAYPVIIRPSYVLSGTGMVVVRNQLELDAYIQTGGVDINAKYPVVASALISAAKEIEVDAVAKSGRIIISAISEHVENAGVHSGDATLVLPAQDLTPKTINQIKQIAANIAANLNITGPFNIQLIAKADNIMVIECNLRASRSFPFASRTLGTNFINMAVEAILCDGPVYDDSIIGKPQNMDTVIYTRVGVKVPMFSFSRLGGSRVALGVEMQSTGEVAAFGPNRNIAFLKAMAATPGFRMPPERDARIILLSRSHSQVVDTNDYTTKAEIGYITKLAGDMNWIVTNDLAQATPEVIKNSHLVIVLGLEQQQSECQYSQIARQAVDYHVPLIINHKLAKLFIESIYYYYRQAMTLDPVIDGVLGRQQQSNSFAQPLPATSIPIINNNRECISYQPDYSPSPSRTEIIFTDKHILSASQFNRNLLRQLFRRASELMYATRYGRVPQILAGRVIGLLFYTPSTRTRCSFESAIKRLGGQTIQVTASESSVMKGETLTDTIRSLETYCNGLVIRTENNVNLPDVLSHNQQIRTRIINAGDLDEHPTQSLLDLFTVRETRGTANGLTYLLTGDLLNGRTIHSLIKLLCNYNCRIICAASPGLELAPSIIDYVQMARQTWAANNQISLEIIAPGDITAWHQALKECDVVYMTRRQNERLSSLCNQNERLSSLCNQNERLSSLCNQNERLSSLCNQNERLSFNNKNDPQLVLTRALVDTMKPDAIILHPLPRNTEIPPEIDNNPRAMYFKQMEYGLYLRMALAELIWG